MNAGGLDALTPDPPSGSLRARSADGRGGAGSPARPSNGSSAAPSRSSAGRPARPGPQGDGVTLLPNGWRIAPAGRHLDAGDLPLAMALHPGGHHLVVTNNGWSKPSLRVVDVDRWQVTQKMPLDHAWLGLVWHPDGRRLFSSGAADNTIREVEWRGDRLVPARTFRIGPPQKTVQGELVDPGFVAGLALSPDGRLLYAADVFGESVAAVDVESGEVVARAPLAAEGYATAVAPDGSAVYATVWGGARVAVLEPRTLKPLAEIPVGDHPNAMAFSKDGGRLFVACAHTNSVWVVDLASRRATERIGVALSPKAPPGSTPNALALSPDGSTLLVANADNNTVAVVDVTRPGESRFLGFVPTGWYPTGVAFDAKGDRVLVLSGKGLAPAANPRGPQPVGPSEGTQYIGALLTGAVSILPRPDEKALAEMTARVHRISAYQDGRAAAPPGRPEDCPVPARVGAPSPIKHVFYVIRENRTYDQVLGDLAQGNGDPNLTLFGEEVTPNAHAIASEFVLFDNFYVDAEVSMDGHSYSTAAYASDAIEKTWPTNYGGRGGLYLGEGSHKERNDYGNLAAPSAGYLWDFAARAGVSVRSYGEFARWEKEKGGAVVATVPGLKGKVHPAYAPFDLTIPDNDRVDVWLEEFRRFEKEGGLPQLNIVRLGNDHTEGTKPGALTPRSLVAENDRALGRVVEADLEEPVLGGVRDPRPRGRRAERAGPRRRAPLGPPRGGRPGEARRRRLGDVLDRERPAHDRARPRPAADEPVRRGGAAALHRLRRAALGRRVPRPRGARTPRRAEPQRRPRRRGLAAHEHAGGRPRTGAGAEPGHLEVGPRRGVRDAAARAGRVRAADRGRGRA